MPWKGEKDPYKIWLSEIILQQTRVEQGLAYYNNFLKTFPTITELACAPDQKVFKLWEGLGYYSRCRNLIATARIITEKYKGSFPRNYEEILALKGIGPYTAAAIASFAFNLPYAVVDGNVFRVLARVFGMDEPIDSTTGKKTFHQLASRLLDAQQPALYNQAIMDFGATVCKPAAPLCTDCFLKKNCVAYIGNRVSELPVKEKKIKITTRNFYFFIIKHKNKIAVKERVAKDIWQHLYEFPLIELLQNQSSEEAVTAARQQGWFSDKSTVKIGNTIYRQKLTHQAIAAVFLEVEVSRAPAALREYDWADRKELGTYSFPKIIHNYLSAEVKGK